jgi:isoquinoline 1-oxidoreductase beta subunit
VTTRRDFLRVAALAGGGLLVGLRLGAEEAGVAEFRPNAWLRLTPDGRIVFLVGRSEMGQGVRTALPMIVAEELRVDLATIEIEQAWPGCGFDDLGTGGSSSMSDDWDRVRTAGAAAREMLVAAAAARWEVDPGRCRAERGRVLAGDGRAFPYAELVAEAARQPVPASPRLTSASERRVVGGAAPRSDGPAIVRGTARYGLDVRLPGMRFAVLARAPSFGAAVRSFDGAPALAVAGVEACFAVPRGVAVVARSTWAALRGREALRVEWSEGPHATFSSDSHREQLTAAVAAPGVTTRRDGEGRAALAAAASRHEATYHYPFAAHAAIEPVNATAWVRDGRCEIWSPTQTPEGVRRFVGEQLGIAPEAVDVHVTLLGGGFGRRLGWDMELDAAAVAARLPHPVQVVWTRDDDLRHGYFQAASAHRLIAGLDAEGRLVAWEHRKASTPHNARRPVTAEQLRDASYLAGSSWGVTDTPYHVPNVETSYAVVEVPVPIGPWRAVYSPSSVFARESFVDELAARAGEDPLAWRLRHLGAGDPSIPPLAEPGGERLDRRRLRRVLELAAEKGAWNAPLPSGRARGIACNVFHTETYIAYVVEVSRRSRPRPGQLPFVVHRVVGAIDCGLVVHPDGARQQVESGVVWALSNMKSAMRFERGRAVAGNFDGFPIATLAETPESIEAHFVTDRDRPHGLGEPTVCPLAPAVTSALARLIGRRLRALPVTAADLA